MNETSPTILAKVLHFLYLGDYHEDESACTSELHGSNLTTSTDLTIDTPLLRHLSTPPTTDWNLSTPPATDDDCLARDFAINNVEVYQCADMWGIELLKVLATVKIMANVRTMSMDHVTIIVKSAFEITTRHDNVLRPAIIDVCIKNHAKITSESPRLLDLLEEHESGTWRAALKCLLESEQKCQLQIAKLKAANEKILKNNREHSKKEMQIMLHVGAGNLMRVFHHPKCETRPRKWIPESTRWVGSATEVLIYCATCGYRVSCPLNTLGPQW